MQCVEPNTTQRVVVSANGAHEQALLWLLTSSSTRAWRRRLPALRVQSTAPGNQHLSSRPCCVAVGMGVPAIHAIHVERARDAVSSTLTSSPL